MPLPSINESLCATLTEEVDVSLLAAGDPVFGELVADDYKAYLRFRIATAFPNVIGPEMHGRFFGFHPQVLAASYRKLLHQQTNLGHKLKAYGAQRDRIVGAIVGVAVGNMQRQTTQTIAETVDAAQYLDVVAVVHKSAEGVPALLGNHTSSRQKTSVSIEVGCTIKDFDVYDPRDATILSMQQAASLYPKLFSNHPEKGLQIGKVDGVQFALAAGGNSRPVPFRGVGYTPNPAESDTARILDLKASSEECSLAAAIAVFDWVAGQGVHWTPILAGKDAGHGTIVEVITAGRVTRHGLTKIATPADPLLDIRIPGLRSTVIRHASSVGKTF